jgi:DNA replication protein DnaC
MRLTNQIDFQNVEALSRQLRAVKVSRERFSLEISEKDACNGIYSAMKAVVEYRGREFVFDADTKRHIQAAAKWLIDPCGTPGLLLCGLCGNGKTSLAQAINWLVGLVTEKEYGYSKRKYFELYTAKNICRIFVKKGSEYDDACKTDMLIIDDLGEEPREVIDYGQPHTPIIDMIHERYEMQRLTIITTNLEADDLREKYGVRVYDRLREMVTSIIFENESYRGRKT